MAGIADIVYEAAVGGWGELPCYVCREFIAKPSHFALAQVGAHVLRGAPRLDHGSYRWVATRDVAVGDEFGHWLEDSRGRRLLTGRRGAPPSFRQLAVGLPFTGALGIFNLIAKSANVAE